MVHEIRKLTSKSSYPKETAYRLGTLNIIIRSMFSILEGLQWGLQSMTQSCLVCRCRKWCRKKQYMMHGRWRVKIENQNRLSSLFTKQLSHSNQFTCDQVSVRRGTFQGPVTFSSWESQDPADKYSTKTEYLSLPARRI